MLSNVVDGVSQVPGFNLSIWDFGINIDGLKARPSFLPLTPPAHCQKRTSLFPPFVLSAIPTLQKALHLWKPSLSHVKHIPVIGLSRFGWS